MINIPFYFDEQNVYLYNIAKPCYWLLRYILCRLNTVWRMIPIWRRMIPIWGGRMIGSMIGRMIGRMMIQAVMWEYMMIRRRMIRTVMWKYMLLFVCVFLFVMLFYLYGDAMLYQIYVMVFTLDSSEIPRQFFLIKSCEWIFVDPRFMFYLIKFCFFFLLNVFNILNNCFDS